jgi:hypothetical protein
MSKSRSEAAQGRDRKKCFQEENGMSSPVAPPQGPTAVESPAAIVASGRTAAPDAGKGASVQSPFSLDALASHPPREVLDRMAQAAQTYESLRSQGRELRFSRDGQSGRTTIEVRDREGNVLKTISPSQALKIAAGAPLE